jgi:hypothetical protein
LVSFGNTSHPFTGGDFQKRKIWIIFTHRKNQLILQHKLPGTRKPEEPVFQYFIERITNGFVEGLNNSIRDIIRSAFGYRNFENFKLRVFAEQGFPTNPR